MAMVAFFVAVTFHILAVVVVSFFVAVAFFMAVVAFFMAMVVFNFKVVVSFHVFFVVVSFVVLAFNFKVVVLAFNFKVVVLTICSFIHRGTLFFFWTLSLKFTMLVDGNNAVLPFTAHECGNLSKLPPLTVLVNDNVLKFRCLGSACYRKDKQEQE
jgi:hypothetical protein